MSGDDQEANPEVTLKEIGYLRLTDRTLDEYQQLFRFRVNDFRPRASILDIGSGANQTFARQLKEVRSDITIVSMDPSLALNPEDPTINTPEGIKYQIQFPDATEARNPTKEEMIQRRKSTFHPALPAIAPHFPFADNSFDYTFDNHAAFMYLNDDHQLFERYLLELLRMLKPGGTAYIFPIDLYGEALLGKVQRMKVSRQRFKELVTQLELTNAKIYPARDGESIRYGVKITKPIS